MRNRCFGCKYFEGFDGCIVRCDLGYENISIKNGCSDFTPDNTAECRDCFYNKGMKNWIIDCSIRGEMDGTQTYCSDYARREEYDCDKNNDKSGCFVTTAICNILGKNDNCYELETLREFRDSKLLTDKNLQDLVFEYYTISPKLVDILKNKDNKKEFAQYLLDKHINLIIQQIENNEKNKAIKSYKNMIKMIEEKK